MPLIVTPAAIRVRLTGGGVGVVDVLVGVVSVVDVSVDVVSVVEGGGESASAYAAAPPATPKASNNARSATRFTAAV